MELGMVITKVGWFKGVIYILLTVIFEAEKLLMR